MVHVPDAPRRVGEPECPHGQFEPLASFFPRRPPPNPTDLTLYTSFGVGAGRAWFVEGAKVLHTENGWTDVDKQSTIGDLLWPRPRLFWEGDHCTDTLPEASSALDFTDAWNGGNSLRLTMSGPGSDENDAFFRCIWIPIQSLPITARKSYEARVIYKIDSDTDIDLDVGLSMKLLSESDQQTVQVTPISSRCDDTRGWMILSIRFDLPADHTHNVLAAIGLVIGFASDDSTKSLQFSLLLGQMTIFPTSPSCISPHQPRLLWANFEADSPSDKLSGILTWDVVTSFAPPISITPPSPENPRPTWILGTSDQWLPTFVYFNIYVQSHASDGSIPAPNSAIFIGTTGLDGRGQRFFVDHKCLLEGIVGSKSIRFLVQGITDKGDLLDWDQCVFVDVNV
jgi:mannosyl-glycoprotein endo-beta-N-acetylglucosaminidase